METKNKSQLAKDLAHALYVCKLRDDLYELVEDGAIQDYKRTDDRIRGLIRDSYRKATILLACAINSKDIQGASGRS
jgi:hypothetical protein